MRPSRPVWVAWGLALVGGLAVIVAVGLVLNDPCVDSDACAPARADVAAVLALAGTAVAVVGGLVATYLTVRRSESDRS